jgi:hypothetical protein
VADVTSATAASRSGAANRRVMKFSTSPVITSYRDSSFQISREIDAISAPLIF